MAEIKPIETYYDGCRFRSRLEARWAVFFNELGVHYEYEPEGFQKNGLMYLPDFRVTCYGTRGAKDGKGFPLYVEVKGEMREEDALKIKTFAHFDHYDFEHVSNDHISLLVVGDIPRIDDDWDVIDKLHYSCYWDMGFGVYPFNYETIEGDHFGAFPAATPDGRFYLMGDDLHYINSEDVHRTANAFRAARRARFEHGEKPREVYGEFIRQQWLKHQHDLNMDKNLRL